MHRLPLFISFCYLLHSPFLLCPLPSCLFLTLSLCIPIISSKFYYISPHLPSSFSHFLSFPSLSLTSASLYTCFHLYPSRHSKVAWRLQNRVPSSSKQLNVTSDLGTQLREGMVAAQVRHLPSSEEWQCTSSSPVSRSHGITCSWAVWSCMIDYSNFYSSNLMFQFSTAFCQPAKHEGRC